VNTIKSAEVSRLRRMAGSVGRRVWPAARTVVPIGLWQMLSGVSLVVTYHHLVSDADVPHVRHLYKYRDVRGFEADLDFLLRHFTPISLYQIIAHLDGRETLPQRCFHVTFDDGFREIHDVVAPLLVKKGIPATFFLNSAFLGGHGMAHYNKISLLLDRMPRPLPSQLRKEIELLLPPACESDFTRRLLSVRYANQQILDRVAAVAEINIDHYIATARPYLSPEEVIDLIKQGFAIGAHSIDHPLYADLSLEEQITQTRQSVDFIVDRFGIKTRAFAFPHSDVGVGPEFFNEMFNSGSLDICFGTGGSIPHFHHRNVERVGMEKNPGTAEAIFAREYARAFYYKSFGKLPLQNSLT
jgi:peptidoglycan/xylan/chitin deacetylase (PgdA/CDA1 family)